MKKIILNEIVGGPLVRNVLLEACIEYDPDENVNNDYTDEYDIFRGCMNLGVDADADAGVDVNVNVVNDNVLKFRNSVIDFENVVIECADEVVVIDEVIDIVDNIDKLRAARIKYFKNKL